MNIAFSAVIVFILLLPPIVFYISLSHGRFQKGGPKLNLFEMLMVSAVFAMLTHAAGVLIMSDSIRFDVLFLLLAGNTEQAINKCSNRELEDYFLQFSLYSSIQLIIAFIIGKSVRGVLKRFSIHSKAETLRIFNHWWYLFNAYHSDSHSGPKKKQSFDMVHVDILVNTGSGAIIYSGYLTDFVCQGENLDRIYLSSTKKREFKTINITDKGNIVVNKPGPPEVLKGRVLSIPATEILNLNVRFIDLSAGLFPIRKHSLPDPASSP